ncbi:MAG: LysR family transcriptional regulator [Pyramidobacter sp.]|nr:LysR family transcriptional regulator [Pyramidobacter sp.]
MNNDIYRYLLTVAQTRNITRAAEMLHISQPALTKAIRRQEKDLGVTLFDRSTTPLKLTYAGERFLESARKLLDIGTAMREEMKNIALGAKERVRLGITVERGTAWLPLILPQFVRDYPGVDVRVMEGTNAFFERAILAGQMDFCVSTLPIGSGDIAYEAVNDAPIYLISSADHPLARFADLSENSPLRPQYIVPELLEGEDFLMLTPAQGVYRVTQLLLEKYALHVKTVMQLTSLRTITLLAAAGMGLTFTTSNGAQLAMAQEQFHPVFYTIEDPMYYRRNIIAWKKDRVFSPAVLALIDRAKRAILDQPHPKIEIRH